MNQKKLATQILVHACSVIFLYLYFKPSKKACKFNKVPKPIPVDKSCFKQQCQKAATENECGKYARCAWSVDSKICKPNAVQCDELSPAENHSDRFTCQSTQQCTLKGDSCEWNRLRLQSGPKPKIINETTGLNKHCSKRTGAYYEKNINEFVEDTQYVDCLNDEQQTRDCEKEAKIRLECNFLNGHSYDDALNICRKLNFKTEKLDTGKKADHRHTSAELKESGAIAQHRVTSDLFVLNDERILRYYVHTFVTIVVILANIGLARWLGKW